ncbi:MAG: 4-(cytidine 5'-diphospho)-2-C-methyl-D-erythritol kinase [Phycisphaeraceae bacterium]|nr:4-(cytidine 5'-diphospho)-2-C-methyl-D-erythritol kinase [Phycisphaeraceae bacterium]
MTPSQSTIQLNCPAKVNLALSVGAPLANGMHPIASLMCTLDFGDQMTLMQTQDISQFDIQFVKLHPEDDSTMGEVDWPLQKDLAYRAWQLMQELTGRNLPVHAKFNKRIPAGAGLAGGSGNAAGILVGLNQLFDLQLTTLTLTELAQQLGSDVVFVVHAMQEKHNGALVTGLGEIITPISLHGQLNMVLIFPPFGCPTGPVYKAFDQLLENTGKEPDLSMVQQMAGKLAIKPSDPFNDLASAACKVQPELAKLQQEITTLLKHPVHITGSGSTMFMLYPDAPTASDAVKHIAQTMGLKCIATQTQI